MSIRIKTLTAAVSMLAATTFCAGVWAQAGGGRTVRWIVPYSAGGGSDVTARVVGEAIKLELGDTFIVDNKPGGGTIIGMQSLLSSAADGATVATADSGTLAFNPHLYNKLPYKPDTSFTYVGGLARIPLVLVTRPGLNVHSVKDLLALARSQPGKFTYASAGPGSPHHIAMEMFQQQVGVKFLHVPYKGAAPAVQDLLGGQVDLMMLDTAGGLPIMKAGKVVMLAAAMPKRLPQIPQVPTMSEAGVSDFVAFAWQGLVAPAGVPAPAVERLDAALRKALASPQVRGRLEELGVEPMPMAGKQFKDYALTEEQRWGRVITTAGVKLD